MCVYVFVLCVCVCQFLNSHKCYNLLTGLVQDVAFSWYRSVIQIGMRPANSIFIIMNIMPSESVLYHLLNCSNPLIVTNIHIPVRLCLICKNVIRGYLDC